MYEVIFSDEFAKQLQKIKKRDKALFERIEKKVKDIVLDPTRLKHLRSELKGQQRVHLGPFVLRFELQENKICFITIAHHDDAY